jgi:hypothetical protein
MNAKDKDYLNLMAKEVDKHLPDNHGFILLAVPFTTNPEAPFYYTASVNREDAIRLLKSFLFKCGEAENWMNHIR